MQIRIQAGHFITDPSGSATLGSFNIFVSICGTVPHLPTFVFRYDLLHVDNTNEGGEKEFLQNGDTEFPDGVRLVTSDAAVAMPSSSINIGSGQAVDEEVEVEQLTPEKLSSGGFVPDALLTSEVLSPEDSEESPGKETYEHEISIFDFFLFSFVSGPSVIGSR